MKNFFVLGSPRSRTLWLANLLTTDRTLCVHDSSDYFHVQRAKLLQMPGYDFVGTSEPWGGRVFTKLEAAAAGVLQSSPLVVIRQPVEQSIRRMNQAIKYDWGPGAEVDFFKKNDEGLERAAQLPNCLAFDLSELSDISVIESIFRHCMPEVHFDPIRAELLVGQIITVPYTESISAQREAKRKRRVLGLIPPQITGLPRSAPQEIN